MAFPADLWALLGRIVSLKLVIERRSERIESIKTLDNANFPDCEGKQFRYGRRVWNPWGKVGFAHHGDNGWDLDLPEERDAPN